MAHHAIAIAIPPFSLGVSLGLRLFADSRQGLVWVVPAVIAPGWASMVHVAHHAVFHHAMAHHAVAIAVPPFTLGVSLGLRFFTNCGQYLWHSRLTLVRGILAVAPLWTSIFCVTHHAIILIAILVAILVAVLIAVWIAKLVAILITIGTAILVAI